MTSSPSIESDDSNALSALAVASHEVRGALAAIISHAELLAERADDPGNSRATALLIERHGRAVLDTFDSILRAARHHDQRVDFRSGPCDLRAMIEELVRLQRPRVVAAGLTIEVSVEDSVPRMFDLDGGSVHRILSNLIENALKYTIHGGMSIRARGTDAGGLSIEVQDTGIGIDPADADRIFDPYVRSIDAGSSRISGVGLGLSLCRDLARSMNAELTFEVGPEGGSIFRLECSRMSVEAAPDSDVIKGARILLIDDCDETLRIHEAMLESSDALVTSTTCTRDLMLEHFGRAGPKAFDLILIDLEMPDLDGWQVCTGLVAQGSAPPVIALTAHEIDPIRDRALQHGFSEILQKPLSINDLACVVERLVAPGSVRLAG